VILHYSLYKCGKRFGSRCKNNEKAQCTCGYETIQNFKDCTGTSKGQTGKGRLNRMCVQSSLLGQIRSVSVRFGKLQDRLTARLQDRTDDRTPQLL